MASATYKLTLTLASLAAGLVLAVLAAGATPPRASAASGFTQVCRSGYCFDLPAGWRYKDASYPSDHATHFYWNPTNGLEQLTITISGCIGCVSRNLDPRKPWPEGMVPSGSAEHAKLSPTTVAYRIYNGKYPTDGLAIVAMSHGSVAGSERIEITLPASLRPIAAHVLNSFRIVHF